MPNPLQNKSDEAKSEGYYGVEGGVHATTLPLRRSAACFAAIA